MYGPAVDEAVIAAMQGHNRGSAVHFVQEPASIAEAGAGYAVVMLLNAEPGTSADFACARRGSFSPPVAVFCGNAGARSWAYSTTGPVNSPDDPLFRALVSQTTYLMIPPRDDDWGGRDFLQTE
jgi:hypothetical protein